MQPSKWMIFVSYAMKRFPTDSPDVVTLREKGSEGINQASAERNDQIVTVPGQKVHKDCRRSYCHPRNYVTKKYGRPIVVFDGYDNSTVSTKQMTQQRRSSGKVGTTVTFEEDMKVTTKKDVFLAAKEHSPCGGAYGIIKKVQAELGTEVCDNILFLHAVVLGCDTTSRVHGHRKRVASLKKFITSLISGSKRRYFKALQQQKKSRLRGNALALLYNGKAGQCLDNLRYQRYQEKARHKDHQNQCRRLGVEDERRPADSCDDGFTSSTRQPSTHSEMQLFIGMQHAGDVPAASTTWNVLLHVASAKALAAQTPLSWLKKTVAVTTNSNLASHGFLCIRIGRTISL
ncbi:hypothetical protein OS493_019316 [Desmophyllum pertusum]|uniref:Uncharacterized protein n=1 Tax=Desmophyllum pertusum TaxID=174260 RepID=A0A9X0D8Y6_9CNID|nr:hypothetical protein OS493_019316 [Desmophyllum pertusum]